MSVYSVSGLFAGLNGVHFGLILLDLISYIKDKTVAFLGKIS
jgi:hypothetical protein